MHADKPSQNTKSPHTHTNPPIIHLPSPLPVTLHPKSARAHWHNGANSFQALPSPQIVATVVPQTYSAANGLMKYAVRGLYHADDVTPRSSQHQLLQRHRQPSQKRCG
jgi:hypothetical protein